MNTRFLLLLMLLSRNIMCKKRYDNFTLFRGIPISEEQVEIFKDLDKKVEIYFWRPPNRINGSIDFVVAPEYKEFVLKTAAKNNLYLTTILKDVQDAFVKQKVAAYTRRRMETFDWSSYHRLEDIYSWMKDLVEAHPKVAHILELGLTIENRKILALNVNYHHPSLRSKVIVEGGIHAREWIGPAFVTYLIDQIINAPKSTNSAVMKVALRYDWYFVPVANPDGYEFSHTDDRLWRKNRRGGYGVDINRNFGIAFGSVGVSSDKHAVIYNGESPFSEPETVALANLVKDHVKGLEYYLAFHSYGQYMILPFAHSKIHMENYDEVYKMGLQARNAISKHYGTVYTVGTAYDTVGYMTSGVSGCWVKKAFGIPYVVTFELRDTGVYGFALPPEQIKPTCVETLSGVLSLLEPMTTLFTFTNDEIDNKNSKLPIFNNHKNTKVPSIILFNCMLIIIFYFD